MDDDTKLAIAAMKLARFYVIYGVITTAIGLASLATAMVWFGWKAALVIFLAEWYCLAASQQRVLGEKYADELEKEMGL